MTGLKVLLFISFLFVAIFGAIGLLVPAALSTMGMMPKDMNTAYTRVIATSAVGFAIAIWFAFRDPIKNGAVVGAITIWFALEGLVLLISGIAGSIALADALPGVILDAILAIGLAIFYPRAKRAA